MLDVGLFLAAFRMLTDRDVSTRDVAPGAIFSGAVFFVLEQLSTAIIAGHLKSAQSTYGQFATVITILWWFYLQAVVTMLGAQLNVVLKDRLYPCALVDVRGPTPPTTPTTPCRRKPPEVTGRVLATAQRPRTTRRVARPPPGRAG